MKRMELLKIYSDLFWAAHENKGFDKFFKNESFYFEFAQFLSTDLGAKWKNTDEGRRYYEWQSN